MLVRRPAGAAPGAPGRPVRRAARVRARCRQSAAPCASTSGDWGTPAAHAMSLLFPYVLAGCVTLAWLIACANVSVLMIAQWTVREHEFSILASLGANRARIVRMLLTESLLIAVAGGTLGIAATFAIHRVILRNAQTLAMFDASIHGDVLAGALCHGADRHGHGNSARVVRDPPAPREPARRHGVRSHRQRWLHTLVVTEIVVTVGLLVDAGTMVDGYRRTRRRDLGFSTRSLLGVAREPRGRRGPGRAD